MNKPSFWYRNSLSLVFLVLFLLTLCAQGLTGWKTHNQELNDAHRDGLTLYAYLQTGHFISATFENFQSEFLQMALYVVLTISLRQQGSAESKRLTKTEAVDRAPKAGLGAPWPVRRGGIWLQLYKNSLSSVFFVLFFTSWGLHFYGSWLSHNSEQLLQGRSPTSLSNYFAGPQFWFETFQNWQSEFLSVLSIVFLTIYLRQKGSPESKPVDAPHMETGN
jgi:hypothetical protein